MTRCEERQRCSQPQASCLHAPLLSFHFYYVFPRASRAGTGRRRWLYNREMISPTYTSRSGGYPTPCRSGDSGLELRGAKTSAFFLLFRKYSCNHGNTTYISYPFEKIPQSVRGDGTSTEMTRLTPFGCARPGTSFHLPPIGLVLSALCSGWLMASRALELRVPRSAPVFLNHATSL